MPLVLNPAIAKYKLNPYELKCLTDNIYYEARGEPKLGQLLVARVTLNRSKSYGSICKAVYEPFQFSWTLKKQAKPDPTTYMLAAKTAEQALYYHSPVYYFHATKIKPIWAKDKLLVAKIGNHVFYQ